MQLLTSEEHKDAFELTPDIGIMMKYPNIDLIRSLDLTKDAADFSFDILKLCIDKVFTQDEIIEFQDHSEEEKDEFIHQFNREEIENFIKFFDTSPKIAYDIKYTNSLGTERVIELRSLDDFFI